MAVKLSGTQKKTHYDKKLCRLLDEYSQIMVVSADNVGSNQLQNIRKGLRGESVLLIGKNTMMKRSIKLHAERTGNNAFTNLVPLLVGNAGLIFTKGDVKEIREETALLLKLGMRPFSYGLTVISVYDNGSVFSPEVLDLTEDGLAEKFAAGVSMVTSLSRAIPHPTIAAALHMLINAYKNVVAVAVTSEYSFPQAEKVKEYLKDPSKFSATAAPGAPANSAAARPKVEEIEECEACSEDSEEDMVIGLFD